MLKGRLGLETARIPHKDRHGVMWLGRGKLMVEDGCLHFITAGFDTLPAGDYSIPFQMISCLLLQPGSTVSHDALRLLARHGTGLVFTGQGGVRFYASMPFGPDTSSRARRQVALWSDPESRVRVVRRMYAWRLGEVLPVKDLNSLRGIEGARVKESYKMLARKYGIPWKGRRYERGRPEATDAANTAINHASSALQGVAMTAVAITGALPQLGFIHEDSGIAFPLDIAHLFREEVLLPLAFQATRDFLDGKHDDLERAVRLGCGRTFRSQGLVTRMIDRIKELLDADDGSGDA